MFASKSINPEIPFLSPEDKGLTALSLLEELKINEMPIVDGDEYIGLVSEIDLLDYDCIEGEINGLKAELKRPFVNADDHMMDVISTLASEDITVLPVLDVDDKYIGSIDISTALKRIAASEGYQTVGGVLELEIGIHDYSMVEVSRIVESNDAKILHFFMNSSPDSNLIHLTLKLNKSNLSGIIQSFERFGYTITASYQQDEYEEDLKKRYEGLLRYLNI